MNKILVKTRHLEEMGVDTNKGAIITLDGIDYRVLDNYGDDTTLGDLNTIEPPLDEIDYTDIQSDDIHGQ